MKDDEINEYKRRVAEAKADPVNIAISEKLQDTYRESKVKALAKYKSIPQKEARKLIPRQTVVDMEKKNHLLSPNNMLEINGEFLPASELWRRGSEFDKTAMPDPIEGGAYGAGTAIFYFNNGNQPCIRSHAHGQITTYKLAGHNEFKPCKTIITKPDEKPIASLSVPANPLDEHSLTGMSAELEADNLALEYILASIAILGQWTVIYARHGTGKTLIVLFLLIEAIKTGRIKASVIYYLNIDDNLAGLTEKLKIADEWGFHILCDGYRGFKVNEFTSIIE